MLRVRDLEAFYGASQALFGMELSVDAGEVVTLMGRNGMGKTTTVHAVMGLVETRRGVVEFDGVRVDDMASFRIARLGLGLVPEGRQIFPNLIFWPPPPIAAPGPIPGRSNAPSSSSRAWPNASATWATSSQAASSRCWRSAAP